MEKRMNQVGVRTSKDGEIEIFQNQGVGDEEDAVYIRSEQVDAVIKWLQEAKAKLEGTQQK